MAICRSMLADPPVARPFCWNCRRPLKVCFCPHARPFRTEVEIAVLIHPREDRRTIGTARIAKACIQNAHLFVGTGQQLDQDPRFQSLISRSDLVPRTLFPGPTAQSLEDETACRELKQILAPDKRLLLLLIDGTWPQAATMMKRSRTLAAIPKLTFSLLGVSRYSIREQPAAHCVSTVEAIHAAIDAVAQAGLTETPDSRAHDNLIEVLDWLVEKQLSFEQDAPAVRGPR